MRPTRRIRSDDGWLADEEFHNGAFHLWPAGGSHDLDDPAGGCVCGPLVSGAVVVHNSLAAPRPRAAARKLGREIRRAAEALLALLGGLLAYAVGQAIDRSGEEG